MELRGYLPVKLEQLEKERSVWQEERDEFLREGKALKEELGLVRDERQALLGEFKETREEVRRLRVELTHLRAERDDLALQRFGLQEGLAEARKALERERGKAEGLLQEKLSLQVELSRVKEERDDFCLKRAEVQQEIEALGRQLEIEKERVEGLLRERGGLQVELEGARWERDRLREERESLSAETKALPEERERVLREIEGTWKGRLDNLERELAALRNEREGLLQQNEALGRELVIERERVEGLLRERGSLQAEVEGARWERDRLRGERENLSEERKALVEERKALLEERRILKEEADSLRRDLEGIKVDRLNQLLLAPEEVPRFVNETLQDVLRKHHHSVFWGDRLLSLDKSAGFYEDEKFSETVREIKGSHAYDQYGGPDGIAWRLHTLVWAARCALEVEGDFVECGVFKGDMSWVVAHAVEFKERKRTFFLYDTFEGFSDRYSSAGDFPLNPNFFAFANEEYKIPGLHDQVVQRFQGFPNVKVIKGVLPDVLSEDSPDRIAFIHVDLNSPAAEIGVLDQLFDRVVPGGMIVFDDYGWLEYVKQKRAEDRFMKSRGYHILELPTGQGLVVKR